MHSKQSLIATWQQHNVGENLLHAFANIPRELFVPANVRHQAYADIPLPTLRNQSISQPSTIMMMLHALDIKEGHTILEVGAGVGYQAALLGKLVGKEGIVISAEIIPELVHAAKRNIETCQLSNVHIYEADGSTGFPDVEEFDRIIITAACPLVPEPLIAQLKEGGILIAPVGDINTQTMVKGMKRNGRLEIEFMGQFKFVPLRGKFGFE
ncbi:protein-L-isoaspartate O-methyltransferase [archaeon]|jgi:protein-L-isoaspartate(D-aspartate) O-methyltransferase|nr:protein-L-isoaspartate O-methyltransferase [archaeon]